MSIKFRTNQNARLIALLLAALLPVAAAQNQPKGAPPEKPKDALAPVTTIKTRSALVMVPAVVTDHSGNAVEGLKQGDFVVLEDGHARTLTVFEEVHATREAVAPLKAANGMYVNHADNGTQPPRRLVIIVLDTVNTPMMDQVFARKQIIKFLSNGLDNSALVSLMMITQTGMKVIHDFTTDTKILVAALRKVQSRQSAAELVAVERQIEFSSVEQAAVNKEAADLTTFEESADLLVANFRQMVAVNHTLNMLREIGNAFRGVPGRKSLIWASAGFPFGISEFDTAFSGTFDPHALTSSDMADAYRATWQALNNANIALYPVDVRGLVGEEGYSAVGGNPTTTNGMNNRVLKQHLEHNDKIATFLTFAERTGGRAFINGNDLASSFRAAASDSTTYYMLGYRFDPSNPKTGWRKLQVKVNGKGLQVRARNGFYVGEELSPEKLVKQDIGLALNSPLEFTAIPLVARWTGSALLKGAEKARVEFEIVLPKGSFEIDTDERNHMKLEFVAIAKRSDRTSAADVSETLDARLQPADLTVIRQKGMRYRKSFDIVPGDYTVRFLVRDDISGRMGSVEAPLKIEVTKK